MRFGDEVLCDGRCSPAVVDFIELDRSGFKLYARSGHLIAGADLRYGEPIKRPAPKVLDADGVEIRVGDTVYGTVDMEYRITSLSEYEPSVVHAEAIEGGNECGDEFIAGNPRINSFQLEDSKLTHRAPVIAADGKPLR